MARLADFSTRAAERGSPRETGGAICSASYRVCHEESPFAVLEARGRSLSLIIEIIFSNMIDRNIGSIACWISSCCEPLLAAGIYVKFT
jgi:hypothetical protein